jgi:hypothetical protein
MPSQIEPASTTMEFLSWVACWIVFLLLQRGLCRRYPGLRTLCRMLFLWTLAVVLVPAAWALFRPEHGARLISTFNHAFGLGVFAQTSLRSLALVRWLAWLAPQAPVSERYVVASLLALGGVMQGLGERRPSLPAAPPE